MSWLLFSFPCDLVLEFNEETMKKTCKVENLSLISYQQAWDVQNALAEKIAAGEQTETLLLLQHPHVYTLGRRGKAENLIWSEEQRLSRDVSVLWVDRGGDITYHGPGQLVGYPLLRLSPIGWQGDRLPQADYVGYLRKLETVLIQTLAAFEIEGCRVEGKTGVWVNPSSGDYPMKIASIGVKVGSKGISRHGFALNVNPDMTYWEGIVPCGLEGVEMTSMAKLMKKSVELDTLREVLVQCFGDLFEREMTIISNGTE